MIQHFTVGFAIRSIKLTYAWLPIDDQLSPSITSLTCFIRSKEFQAKLSPVFQLFRLHTPLESLQSSFNVLGISHALAVDTDGKLERCTERFGSSLHSVVATPITGERMDQWLNDGPGLVYVKELCTWVVVNNKAELISWTDDPAEIAWLSLWVQYKATIKEVDRGTDNRASKAVGQRRRRVSTPKYARPAPWFTVAPKKETKGVS
jgi:hypothetical protein